MAFSMACSCDWSYGLMTAIRASGTWMVAICGTGVGAP